MTTENGHEIPDWLMSMPKVELHVHLEGTIEPETLWKLSQKHGVDPGAATEQGTSNIFDYSDFTSFIDTFTACFDCLRSPEDLGLIVEAYGAELARQHVRYAELHFNPEPHARRRGISMVDALVAMNCAREKVLAAHGIELRWIADGVRDASSGPISAERTVDWMIEAGDGSGIVALGLGGNELGNPPRLFANAFRRAKAAGFHVVAHAGEALGAESVWETLRELDVERIGHGVTAAEDPVLLSHLAQRGVPLEICPTSNIGTKVVRSIDELPLRKLREAGVAFSINSDDPPMFGTDLVTEYNLVRVSLGLDRQAVARLVAAAIEQSFADESIKRRLHGELTAHTAGVIVRNRSTARSHPSTGGSVPDRRLG